MSLFKTLRSIAFLTASALPLACGVNAEEPQTDDSLPEKTLGNYMYLDSGHGVFLTPPKKDGTRWFSQILVDEAGLVYPVHFNSIEAPSRLELKSAAETVVKMSLESQTGYLASMAHAMVNGFVGQAVGGVFKGTGDCIAWATHIHDNPAGRAGQRLKIYADEWLINPATGMHQSSRLVSGLDFSRFTPSWLWLFGKFFDC